MDLHPNFRSIVSDVQSLDEINSKLKNKPNDKIITTTITTDYNPINFQHDFLKATPPQEEKLWLKTDLQKFKIDLQQIDRLYYINNETDNESSSSYDLIVRLNNYYYYCNEEGPLYAHLGACTSNFGSSSSSSSGFIFVTTNVYIFLLLITPDKLLDVVFDSLSDEERKHVVKSYHHHIINVENLQDAEERYHELSRWSKIHCGVMEKFFFRRL